MWLNLSTQFDAQLIIIECVLDKSLHKKRIESRIRGLYGIPEVTWNDVENRRKEYLIWEEKRLVVDTAEPTDNNLGKIFEYISSAA